jgi:hypothetical protein
MLSAPPFIVYALPRSRTAWLSAFLSHRDHHCGHDVAAFMRSMEDVRGWLSQDFTGTVETAAAPWWRTIHRIRPDIRTAVVRRPVPEVVESLMAVYPFDREALEREMRKLDAKLDQIERRIPGVISVSFNDLRGEAACKRIFEHCLPYRHDPAWWASLSDVNVQISVPAQVRYYRANKRQIDRLVNIAKQQTLSGMVRRHAEPPEGVTFQPESVETWLRDAVRLFEEHCVLVEEPPDNYLKKNIPLLLKLEKIGAVQIMTARCNGRMFGYLLSLIAPSLESPDIRSGQHLTFFASKEFPGIGMKLLRAANENLAARGATEIFMRAGVRGVGHKMGAVYRRLGAEEFGEMYRLDLGAA